MIKRIIGVLFTLVTLAIVVFAVMNYGNYRSMLGMKSEGDAKQPTEQTEAADTMAADTTAADAVESADEPVAIAGEAVVER